ncbi:MAG: WG repeat-containing protein [Firmicutes bacterium]|nr:WG repeat-containing protein [Bacillota bacterium]
MDWIGQFSNGVAACEKNGAYGFIDTSGNVVITPDYEMDIFHYNEGLVIMVYGSAYGEKMGVLQITKS